MDKVNLLPDELIRPAMDPRKLLSASLAILFVILLAAGYGFFLYKSRQAAVEVARLQKVSAELQPEVRRLESLRKQKAELEKALLELEGLAGRRLAWSPVIAEINNNLPAETWLTALQFYFDQEGRSTTAPEQQNTQTQVLKPPGQGDTRQALPAVMSVPNSVLIQGESASVLPVSVFAGRLLKVKYFSDVRINDIHEDREIGLLSFSLTAWLGGGER